MCYQTLDLFYKALRVDIEIEDPEASIYCALLSVRCPMIN